MKLLSGDWGDDKAIAIQRDRGQKRLVIAKGHFGAERISPTEIAAATPHEADNPARGARRVVLTLQDGRRGLIACSNPEFDALIALTFQRGAQPPASKIEKRRFPYFSAALLGAFVVFGPSLCSSLSERNKQGAIAGSSAPDQDRAGTYTQSVSVKLVSKGDAPDISLCTEDALSIVSCLDNFHALAKLYEEGADIVLTREQQAERQAFKQRVSALQRQLLPAMRDKYGALAAKAAWIDDAKVRTYGAGSKTIEFTGWQFAVNRNIQRALDEALPMLRQMRFKSAAYRSHDGANGAAFDLSPLDDAELAVIDGEELRPATE